MKIALLGYGKMGRMVEAILVREGLEVGPRLDIADNAGGCGITRESMAGVDVAIDFSQPEAVIPNVEAAARAGVNLVVGTTGWDSERSRVERVVLASDLGLVYASNFSVGMNLFFEIAAQAARVVGRVPQYDVYMTEEHHRAKKDSPSGTAITLRKILGAHFDVSNLPVASVRVGHIPGNHSVGFDSEADTIVLEHRARNRQGFAEGAVLAARWIVGRKGMYDFRAVFREILGF
jgi:4-hydroxy-tetrahydrodipicolinate reductase